MIIGTIEIINLTAAMMVEMIKFGKITRVIKAKITLLPITAKSNNRKMPITATLALIAALSQKNLVMMEHFRKLAASIVIASDEPKAVTQKFGLNYSQFIPKPYSVGSPCRIIYTVCGFTALSAFGLN